MYIIATVHYDIKGPERLEKLLKRLKPRSVSLEWSVESGSLVPEYGELIEDINLLENLTSGQKSKLRNLDLPTSFEEYLITCIDAYHYELKVPVRLRNSLGYKIYCVDYPKIRKTRLKQISISEEGITKIPPEKLEILRDLPTKEILDNAQEYMIYAIQTLPFMPR